MGRDEAAAIEDWLGRNREFPFQVRAFWERGLETARGVIDADPARRLRNAVVLFGRELLELENPNDLTDHATAVGRELRLVPIVKAVADAFAAFDQAVAIVPSVAPGTAFRRAAKALRISFFELIDAWGWRPIIERDGWDYAASRLNRIFGRNRRLYLRAALSYREAHARRGNEDYPAWVDDAADRAESEGLGPIAMGLGIEQAKLLRQRRFDRWRYYPIMGSYFPSLMLPLSRAARPWHGASWSEAGWKERDSRLDRWNSLRRIVGAAVESRPSAGGVPFPSPRTACGPGGCPPSSFLLPDLSGKTDVPVTLPEQCPPLAPAKEKRVPAPGRNDERDKWMLVRKLEGATLKTIIAELKIKSASEHWELIDNAPGVTMAIRRYCERQGIDRPIGRVNTTSLS